jgi:calcineurin-like phosphoesterase family protein
MIAIFDWHDFRPCVALASFMNFGLRLNWPIGQPCSLRSLMTAWLGALRFHTNSLAHCYFSRNILVRSPAERSVPMPNVWFTADFHLGHKNIIRYCNRPFDTVEEMNRTIFERLNSLVKTNDILYFLGDFCIGPKARAAELRRQIRCKKIFAVPGNHDKDTRKLTQEFSWLGDLAEVSINGQRIVLCHYAMRVWNHSSHGAWHLYGHSHGRLPSLDASLSMDVGVDTHEFRPWHFDEIRDRMKQRAASTPG